jgi:hypothetical protein
MRSLRFAPALLVAGLISACDSEPTTPTVDVDAALDQMASGGISTYTTAAAGAINGGAGVPVPAGAHSASCAYSGGTGFFTCAPVTAGGITFARQFQLLDASGAPLAEPNPLLIASIRSVIDVEGTHTGTGVNPVTVQIDRHEDATLSGIQSTSRVLNGSATQQVTVTGSGNSLSTTEASTTTNLMLPSTPQQKYPLGGTIVTTGTMTTSGVTTSTQPYQSEITFDGTSIMTVKLTLGGSTLTCKIDLAPQGGPQSCS